jgi:di/tricarboxylate transporter
MTLPQWLVIIVLVIPLGLAALNRLRIDIAALLIAVALGIAQFAGLSVLGPPDTPGVAVKAISGLGQPVVVTLLSLFIISHALDKTGVTRWIARHLIKAGGASEVRLIGLFAATAALLSLIMNNLAAGALLLPSAMDAARRTGVKPSKLLIPVAYGTLLGGAATYFTTANIIVSDLLTSASPPQAPLKILDFTPVGGLMAVVGIAFIVIFGRRLLPDRAPLTEQLVPRPTGSELEDVYRLGERLWEAQVLPDSALAGKSLAQGGLGERLGLAVAAIWRGRQAILAPDPDQIVQPGDMLLVVGREERVSQLAGQGLKIGRESANGHISARGVSLIEVMPAPHSQAEGKTLKELEFRKKYGLTAVALWRDGRSYRTDVADFKLRLGDSFLMVGSRQELRALRNSPDFIVLEPDTSDQPANPRQVALAVGITAGAVLISILGFPVYLAMLAGAVLTVLTGLVTMEEAYRAVEWQAIFLIAGMYSVSLAMVQTGLAGLVGQAMVNQVASLGPLGLAAGCYLLTALLTQAMGGQVTALVTGPIAISAAIHFNTNPQAMAVVTAIGCSASFLTPMAHPVNILMIGPGNYRFGDYFRLGWGLTIVSFFALLAGLMLFWRL